MTDMLPAVSDSARRLAGAVTGDLPGSAALISGTAPATPPFRESFADAGETSDIVARLDRLLDYLLSTEQTVRVDGRDFGRLVREYA